MSSYQNIATNGYGSFIGTPCSESDEGTQFWFTETYGPFTQTEWGQGVGYNDALDYAGCTQRSNGKPPVGCVATSIGQIMKYHQKPSTYSWIQMPNIGGSPQTANLLKDVAIAANMEFGCEVSGANKEETIMALNSFGYNHVQLSDYSGYSGNQILKQEIENERPVILTGGRNSGWWIFNRYDDGHAWVCDGYRLSTIFVCQENDDPRPDPEDPDYSYQIKLGANGYFYASMNWGWSGNYNGWFSNDWTPGTYDFNYDKKIIYNIY
ncbi:C10 family peptidase [Autumnicola musiva]|uniref:C10 family peptidase n=1 Tax=Autumnicola musiva TaxID=3075589 RepID=A0ABU3D6X6_9FLAO|nr:C10 family peptidase [Zunongwangia sp. F117]MDT0677294.1 C10 family peptidase [Zunongwangia sp. F117]